MMHSQRNRRGFTLIEVVVSLAVFLVVAGLAISFLAGAREAGGSLSRLARQEAATTSLLRQLRADAVDARGFKSEPGKRVRFQTPDGELEYELLSDVVVRRRQGSADMRWPTVGWRIDLRPVGPDGGVLLDVVITGRKDDPGPRRQPWTLRTTLRAMGS